MTALRTVEYRRPSPGYRDAVSAPRVNLAGLDDQQAALLASLTGADSEHRELLTSLVVSNTLIELSKLASRRLGLGEFAAATLTTLAHCTPLDGCALVLDVDNLGPVVCTLGDWPTPEEFELERVKRDATSRALQVCPVHMADRPEPIGYLGVCGVPRVLMEAGVLERTADYLTSTLTLIIDNEYLRRAASAGRAMELVAALDDNYGEDDLFDIVSTLAALPGAVGATLTLEVPRFAGPVVTEAGLFPVSVTPAVFDAVLEPSGTASIQMWWDHSQPPTDSRFGEIVERLVGVLRRAEQTARLKAEAETDDLTGIGNRRRASKALTQTSARAKRTGEEYAVLLMDLDRFKLVNDQLGHGVGDEVLQLFARTITAVVRGYDGTARWGGEEFLLVCPTTDQLGAEGLARRLLDATPLVCGKVLPGDWCQTVSIGIAVCRHPDTDPIEVVRAADAAMYQAKTLGRNRFVVGPVKGGR